MPGKTCQQRSPAASQERLTRTSLAVLYPHFPQVFEFEQRQMMLLTWKDQSCALHQKPKQNFGRMETGGRNKEKQAIIHPIPLPALVGTVPAASQCWGPNGPREEGMPRVAQRKHSTLPKLSCTKSFVLQISKARKKNNLKVARFKVDLI